VYPQRTWMHFIIRCTAASRCND